MDANGFRRSVLSLVRALGVLDEARTPCGVDLSVREAYALDAIADVLEPILPHGPPGLPLVTIYLVKSAVR